MFPSGTVPVEEACHSSSLGHAQSRLQLPFVTGWAAFVGAAAVSGGHSFTSLWEGWQSGTAWAVLGFMAVSGAAAAFLQSKACSAQI